VYAKKIILDFGIDSSYDEEEPYYSTEEFFDNRKMTEISNCAKFCGVPFDEMQEWLYTQI
jgi:hypothetical protein